MSQNNPINSDTIKAALLQYYRYDKQYKLVALESYHFHNADVVCVNNKGHIIETEVKVSIADMKVDIYKPKHYVLRKEYLMNNPDQEPLLHARQEGTYENTYKYRGHEFVFAVPCELEKEAKTIRDSYYPYAGLILVKQEPYFYSLSMFGIRLEIHPYHFTKPKADIKLLSALVKDQSATLTRLAVENCRLLSNPLSLTPIPTQPRLQPSEIPNTAIQVSEGKNDKKEQTSI